MVPSTSYERLKGLGMTFGHHEPIDMGHVKTIYGRDPEVPAPGIAKKAMLVGAT